MPIRTVVLVLAMAAASSTATAAGTSGTDRWQTVPPAPKLLAATQGTQSEDCRQEVIRVWSEYPRRFEWRRVEVCWPRPGTIH